MTTSSATKRYWLATFQGWLEARELPGPQADEAGQVIEDCLKMIDQGILNAASAEATVQHVVHIEDDRPLIHTKVTRNTKGYNYEASVTTRGPVEDNLNLSKSVLDSLARVYGQPAGGGE